MSLTPNTRLGPYEILAPLGAGGMGEVFLANDTRLDRKVAIKALPKHLASDSDRLGRFEREARLLASLNHPNIGAIHGFETAGAGKFLVLEYVEGQTLAHRLSAGALPPDEALDIARQIAEALEAAHEKGIVHRDLKPGNVMVRPDGAVKVLDFGLARAVADDSSAARAMPDSPTVTSPVHLASPTMPGVILGTAGYMSPEQARGRSVDKRSDIFSFGCVVHEMLTGRQPFVGETVTDSIGAVLHKEPDWALLPPGTPATIRLLLRRCLAKDRNKRLRDIGDARIEIESVIADPASSSLGLAVSPAGAAAGSRRLPLARGVGVGVAVLVIGALGLLAGRRWSDEPPGRVRKYEFPLHDQGTWNVGQPAISPDGTMVAYVDRDRIWIRRLDSWDARAVENSERGIIPFWSPDGKWLAFGRGQELLKAPAAGGRPVLITQAGGTFEMIAGGAWSADGRIFFSTGDAGIFVVSADGGVPETYVAADLPDDDDFHELTLLPDGKTVIFTVHSRMQPWHLASFDGKERKVVCSLGGHFAVTPAYSPSGHLLIQRFSDTSSTWAIPFDPGRATATGAPFLVAEGDSDPSVSDTGTLVLTRSIAHYFGGRLVRIDLETLETQPFAGVDGIFSDPALSPDGKALALSGFDMNAVDIWIIDVESGSRTRMTFDETKKEILPRWSPDGKEIAFAKTSTSTFERIAPDDTIHFAAVDGSGEPRAPIEGAFPSFDAAWKYIAFVRTSESTGRNIYFMPMDKSTEARELLGAPYQEEHPALSPDGHWLAYTSNEAGNQAVYLTRFPSGQGKWQVSGPDGKFPRWSKDGTHIYFAGPEVGVYEVGLTSEPRVILTSARRVLDGPKLGIDPYVGLETTPDGKGMLVMQSRGSDRPSTIGIIENWFSEFKDRP